MAVAIKIALHDTPAGISTQVDDGATLLAQVKEAIGGAGGVVEFTDTKGQQYLVPSATIAYVQVGQEEERRVGFVTE